MLTYGAPARRAGGEGGRVAAAERLALRALLAGTLLWAGAASAHAQAAAPPAPPQAPAPAAPAAPSVGDLVYTGDRMVAEGETVEDVVVVGGTLTVRGRVTGDAVVVGGDLIMEDAGLVLGDALVTGGTIELLGGEIRGEMRTLDGAGAGAAAAVTGVPDGDEIEAEIERQLAGVEREIERESRRAERRERAWFDPIRDGFAGLISTLALGLVLGGIGAALVFYGRPYLETVSDTLRASKARSMGVGLAAGFLIVPAFVVMVVALAVSIIGIPFLLVAVPLYPLAVAAAVAFGLLAAAHAIGERTAEQQGKMYDRLRSNSYSYLFTGLAMLLAPLLAANLIEMTGFLQFLGTLLKFVTAAAIWVIATAGFGAVILSRAGTRRVFTTLTADAAYEPDPMFDDEVTRGPHV